VKRPIKGYHQKDGDGYVPGLWDVVRRIYLQGLISEDDYDDFRALFDAFEEYKGAITWGTDCLNCSSLLDANYGQYVKLSKIRELAEGWAGTSYDSSANRGDPSAIRNRGREVLEILDDLK
jgi:hypothetical protein